MSPKGVYNYDAILGGHDAHTKTYTRIHIFYKIYVGVKGFLEGGTREAGKGVPQKGYSIVGFNDLS